MQFRKRLLLPFLGAAAICGSGLAIRPAGIAETGTTGALLMGAKVDDATLALIDRSCQNCHSERTEWPWYSRVPPASWLVHRDVGRARTHLNLSRWEKYSPAERRALLSQIGSVVRNGSMPPIQYKLLHPASKLSPAERSQVYEWTRSERSRAAR